MARHYWAPSLPSLAKEGKPNFQSLSIRNLAGAGKKAEKHALLPFWLSGEAVLFKKLIGLSHHMPNALKRPYIFAMDVRRVGGNMKRM